MGLINATDGRVVANIPLDGHPESFQLSKTAGGMVDKIYANIPVSNTNAIIDAQGKSVVSKWKIGPRGANYPMALDAGNHTLFVGVRSPPKLVVYDTPQQQQIRKLLKSILHKIRMTYSSTREAARSMSPVARALLTL